MQPEIQMLPISRLQPCEVNPRFSVGDVSELADSIAALGVLVPLLVTPHGKGYLIVAGHRRHKACKQIGLSEVPAIIREMTELDRLQMMLVENMQRVPLSPVEEGIAYARILKQQPITQKQLAKNVGKSEYYVSTRLAILQFPKHVLDAIHRGELSVGVALGYVGEGARKHGSHVPGIRPTPCKLERHRNCNVDICEVRQMAEGRVKGKRLRAVP